MEGKVLGKNKVKIECKFHKKNFHWKLKTPEIPSDEGGCIVLSSLEKEDEKRCSRLDRLILKSTIKSHKNHMIENMHI